MDSQGSTTPILDGIADSIEQLNHLAGQQVREMLEQPYFDFEAATVVLLDLVDIMGHRLTAISDQIRSAA